MKKFTLIFTLLMLFAFTVSYPRDVGFDNHSLKIEKSNTIPILSPATDRLFTLSEHIIKVSNTGYAFINTTMPPQKDMEPYSSNVRYLFGNSKINWSVATLTEI